MGPRHPFGVMETFENWIVVMVEQLYKFSKVVELYT